MMNRMIVGGLCAIMLAATACAGGSGSSGTALTSPSVAAVPTSRVTATAVDGPLKALKKAVANCGGNVVDALQVVFAGAGHSPLITNFSDSGTIPYGEGTLTFTFGSTTFTITYTDSNGDRHFSCGDTVTDANP